MVLGQEGVDERRRTCWEVVYVAEGEGSDHCCQEEWG